MQFLVRWESSHSYPTSKTILVAPLTPQRGLTPPLNLYSSQCNVRIVSSFDIPDLNKKTTLRRAEYSRPTDATRHGLDVRCNRSHQQALYEFALVTCLGVSSAASSSSLLLDLACGVLLPFGGHNLTKNAPLKVGLDQFVRPTPGIDFAQCLLVGSRLPLRDSSVDYLVTISFAQWVTADDDHEVIRLFAQECVRVLANRGGEAVLQFYPGNKRDLDAICEALADAHHCVRGCRLSVEHVVGLKWIGKGVCVSAEPRISFVYLILGTKI
ncbi:hypothetical protein TcWFU_006058 [Taenia crassiceps]|uniref:Methyltransferase type 11 domain-containing protein n=1 Tax=Taenia crassiceps TaxID=6207 RepID=A0ABR4Q002_9CEST